MSARVEALDTWMQPISTPLLGQTNPHATSSGSGEPLSSLPTQPFSLFLRLPIELRHNIYEVCDVTSQQGLDSIINMPARMEARAHTQSISSSSLGQTAALATSLTSIRPVSHQPQQPFALLRLPKELRLVIYELCVSTNTKRTLRSPDEIPLSPSYDCHYRKWDGKHLSYEINLHSFPAILQVSHQIHSEAKPVFYAVNKFHYSIGGNRIDGLGENKPLVARNTPFRSNLRYMKHISLALCEPSHGSWGQGFKTRAEAILPKFLKEINKQCGLGLRTLDIQLVSTKRSSTQPEPGIPIRLLSGNGAVASILLQLRPTLDSLRITGFAADASMDVLEDICVAVAPDCFWEKQAFRAWPSVELGKSVAASVHKRLGNRNFLSTRALIGMDYAYRWELGRVRPADSQMDR